MRALLILGFLGMASAFLAPVPHRAAAVARVPRADIKALSAATDETAFWTGGHPPSSVLGPFLSKVPSVVLGPASLVFLLVGMYAVHESNIFHTLTVDTINPAYVLASFLCPISWGTHVASWIQKKNGL